MLFHCLWLSCFQFQAVRMAQDLPEFHIYCTQVLLDRYCSFSLAQGQVSTQSMFEQLALFLILNLAEAEVRASPYQGC